LAVALQILAVLYQVILVVLEVVVTAVEQRVVLELLDKETMVVLVLALLTI
jgi:hypothetical protein